MGSASTGLPSGTGRRSYPRTEAQDRPGRWPSHGRPGHAREAGGAVLASPDGEPGARSRRADRL